MENFGVTQQMDVSNKTMISPSVGGQATLMGVPVKCVVCGMENPPTEKYCGDCGFLLSSTPSEDVGSPGLDAQPKLVASTGETEYFLKQGENSVGRENSDVLLSDPAVSRSHARITLSEGKCLVEDLGSTNGTYAAGTQVTQGAPVEVADGTEIKFGSVKLILKLPAAKEEPVQSTADVTQAVEVADAAGDDAQSEANEGSADDQPAAEESPTVEEAAIENTPVAKLFYTTDASKEYAIKDGVNTIGRRSANDIVISDDPYVSGSHAQIVVDQLGIWLVDLGSTNGTMLNGAKIDPDSRMALSGDDEIVFGRTSFRFVSTDR